MAVLIVFSGLPGTGKSTVAFQLAGELGAVWLRIDTIEQAMRDSGALSGSLDDAGYRAAHAVAHDNLRLGRTVVADCVNPWMITRDAWRDLGRRAGAVVLEVEIVCSDATEHRRRVEGRVPDITGLRLPDWSAVIDRDYHPWDRAPLRLDTARLSVAECVAAIRVQGGIFRQQ
ncbi:AAA family ATPase [Shumkonia mesophila]|uniref:AAA family ATPase n=1 Tax=Shumkonia mesophila TaxID=2838854 RepID=UPI00293433FC|nr:AAA family ATPase [Shumkonia mesophila]